MTLNYHPHKWEILLCNFGEGFKIPEMVKNRPVIIVSNKMAGRSGLSTVVPISSTKPDVIRKYHCQITRESFPKRYKFKQREHWVKCDMIYAISHKRLDRFKLIDNQGNRHYKSGMVLDIDRPVIEKCILYGLGMMHYLE